MADTLIVYALLMDIESDMWRILKVHAADIHWTKRINQEANGVNKTEAGKERVTA